MYLGLPSVSEAVPAGKWRAKRKKGGTRNKRGTKKKEEAGGGGGGGVTREKKETARRTRGKYGYFSIVIHRARISNYNDGWEKGPGPARLSVLACAKNSRDEDRGSRRWVARLPVFSARGSSGAMIYHRLPVRAPPAKLFFFRNVDRRYFYILIDLQLSNWH